MFSGRVPAFCGFSSQKNWDIGVTTFYQLLTGAGPLNRCPLTMGVSYGQKLDHIQHILFTALQCFLSDYPKWLQHTAFCRYFVDFVDVSSSVSQCPSQAPATIHVKPRQPQPGFSVRLISFHLSSFQNSILSFQCWATPPLAWLGLVHIRAETDLWTRWRPPLAASWECF